MTFSNILSDLYRLDLAATAAVFNSIGPVHLRNLSASPSPPRPSPLPPLSTPPHTHTSPFSLPLPLCTAYPYHDATDCIVQGGILGSKISRAIWESISISADGLLWFFAGPAALVAANNGMVLIFRV
jgi:hypothetical protein